MKTIITEQYIIALYQRACESGQPTKACLTDYYSTVEVELRPKHIRIEVKNSLISKHIKTFHKLLTFRNYLKENNLVPMLHYYSPFDQQQRNNEISTMFETKALVQVLKDLINNESNFDLKYSDNEIIQLEHLGTDSHTNIKYYGKYQIGKTEPSIITSHEVIKDVCNGRCEIIQKGLTME